MRALAYPHGGRGKGSGLELDALSTRGADVVNVRHGKVTKVVMYFDRERALADLGLALEGDAANASDWSAISAVSAGSENRSKLSNTPTAGRSPSFV
jgi:hypothetical protein